ncbi:hypothetical protein NLG97_g6560 [Lecanicillium saksenae]|uniref:Uncharacterized protein n=1 Tax=Lecanicillium saksenae TaxID=468837 RepID=A0ACC1QRV8_9HYPO|nr:hypothetical protein NLG97_g6560 [Lecanicillium saksenae]
MADLNLAYLDKEGMSWSHWVVQHWTATILGYGFICNAFMCYYFEKNRWLRRASAVPDADETRGESKDADELAASSPLGSMKDVEEASQSGFEAAFGVKMGGLLHRRVQSDVERRNRSVPRDLSTSSFDRRYKQQDGAGFFW